MIVVSDTTPLRYLAVIGGLGWLETLFGTVICPPEVLGECLHDNSPEPLRAWATSPPQWLVVTQVPSDARELPPGTSLDAGEAAALRLALEIRADLVLLDERRGRAVAERIGVPITGTLGVLVEASLHGLADFEAALTHLLQRTNFRVGVQVIAAARDRLAKGLD